MNANQDPEKDQAVDSALKEWVVDAPLPPRFQEQVWQRIARAEVSTSIWRRLPRLIGTHLPRPGFAYSYVAILVLVGVVSGALAAQHATHRLNAALGAQYMQSVDPFKMVAMNP